MSTGYRPQAETLIEEVSDLQHQVLLKHTVAFIEELHDILREEKQKSQLAQSLEDDYRRERDACIDVLRTIYAERGEDERISELCNGILARFTSSA